MLAARSSTILLSSALALLVAGGCPGAALAQGRDAWDSAKGHFDRGAALYEAGSYRDAEDEFLQAYELSRLPDLLFNLARAAERQGHPQQARQYLEKYLRERPQAQDRRQIEADIERLRRLEQPPGGAPAPSPAPAAAEPGPSRVPPWPVFALGAGGLAFLITGFGLGGAALSAAGQIEAARDGAPFDKALHGHGQSLSAAAIALDVIGVAALGAGAAWTGVWLYHRRRQPPRALLLPAGPGLQLVGSF